MGWGFVRALLDLLFTRELMIPLASGEAGYQNIPKSQNVSICLTPVGVWLNSGLVSSLLDVSNQPPNWRRKA